MNWLSTEGMVEFLEKALADLKLILDGTLTREAIVAGVKANAEFVHAQRAKLAGPPTATVVPKEAEAPPAATATATEAPLIPPVPRRRRPMAVQAEAAPASAATDAPPTQPPVVVLDISSSTPPEPPAPTAGG
jgi:hypothetical protein